MMVEDIQTCDRCGKQIKDGYSVDIWVSETTYDEDGEPMKVGEPADVEYDYIVFCSKCKMYLYEHWETLLNSMEVTNET